MEEIHRRVLTANITFLKENVLIEGLLDHLYEDFIITLDLKQKISYEKTVGSKVSELVCMLPRRGNLAFDALLKALRATRQEYIAEYLEEKVSEITAKQYKETKTFTITWLQKSIEPAGEGSGISVEDLYFSLNSAISSSESNNEDLCKPTVAEFRSVLKELLSVPESVLDQNLLPYQLRKYHTTDTATSVSPNMNRLPKSMKSWSMTDVAQWLEKIEMDSEVIADFRREKITGKSLMLLTEAHLLLMPGVRIGDRLVIIEERENYLKDPNSLYQDDSKTSDTNPSYGDVAAVPPNPSLDSTVNLLAESHTADSSPSGKQMTGSLPSSSLCSYVKNEGKVAIEVAAAEVEESGKRLFSLESETTELELKDDVQLEQLDKIKVSESETKLKEIDINPKSVEEECRTLSSTDEFSTETSQTVLKPQDAATEPKNLDLPALKRKDTVLKEFIKPSEVLRAFGTLPHSSFTYKGDARLSCVETRSGGNLLQPIHKFVILELDKSGGMKKFANEAVSFACACLNDRANGTIHFGIIPEPSSGGTVHGQITGLCLKNNLRKYRDFLEKAFKNCFVEDHLEYVQKCVSSSIFIQVIFEEKSRTSISEYVIEFDVTPSFCEDKVFCARLNIEKGAYENAAMYRILDGKVCQLKEPQVKYYMEHKSEIAKDRKRQENAAKRRKIKPKGHLCEKFLRLLCYGEETFQGDQYRILVINKPSESVNVENMKETFAFLANIEWKAIFDFDAEAKVCNFLQDQEYVMKIAMSDDFSQRSKKNRQKHDRLKQFQEDIRNSVHPTWIFVNGYNPNYEKNQSNDQNPSNEQNPNSGQNSSNDQNPSNDQKLPPREWKMERSDGFKEAVRFLARQIPENRALVVFLLFSEDTSVVLEAAEEFMTSFPNQWLCMAEKESIGNPWIEELQRRNCVDGCRDRVVFGMPWRHVQEAVAHVTTPRRRNCCELPSSTGTFIELPNKMINQLLDLEILGSFECDNADITIDAQKLQLHEEKEKELFFQGNGVSWWNFWFQGQICRRDILHDLKKAVDESLNGDGEDNVGKVILKHQPGAGGTTTAKHLLWELRKSYRCGIVHSINEGQTAEQIITFYQFGDDEPKPVLLLLDNPDEEKANLLVSDLSERAKGLTRKGEDQAKCICTFLICLRRTEVGSPDPRRRLVLKHELTPQEHKWFKDMYRQLVARHEFEPNIFTDPKLLISFNILKENFNKDFIHRMVKSFIENITKPKERRLLTFISLVNSFDLDCRALPTSAFDGIMVDIPWTNKGLRRGKAAYVSRWETDLSPDFRVLINEASKPSIGYIHALRVIHPLLSNEILSCLRDSGDSKVALSEIALEFYSCNDIFYAHSKARDDLLDIAKDILKRRGRLPNGKPETHFAPLIQTIVKEETTEKASVVMELGLQLTSDPFIAQQMARLFISVQNWTEAVKYATLATDEKPDNSYLWDTFGRVYERQLLEQYDKLVTGTRQLSVEESVPIMQIALKGMDMFRKVQETSEKEKTVSTNQAGFFGELQMVVCLLDCLTYFFHGKDEVRRIILETKYVPDTCAALQCVDGINYTQELKQLGSRVQTAVNRVEDELLQLKEEVIDEFRRNHIKYHGESLIRLKENLDSYFGEDGDNAPESLEEWEKCEFRRRRIFRLAGFNLRSIYQLRFKPGGEETLKRIQDIAKQNVMSDHAKVNDFQTVISASLALTSMGLACQSNVSDYDNIVQWTKKLYELRESSIVPHLEPYLFFVMFNWPRENSTQYVNPKVIEEAIRSWKDAYYRKYPRQRSEGKPFRKKDTTMFFLANGTNMESIYSQFEEVGMRLDNFWRMKSTMSKLLRLTGILSDDGNEVKIQLKYGQGNKSSICIPTSFQIRDRKMCYKQVYFVIGFSWIGPKAYDVTLDDPRPVGEHLSSQDDSLPISYAGKEFHRSNKIPELTEEDFRNRLAHFEGQLVQIQQLKDKRRQRLKLNSKEEQLLQEENKIQQDKRRLIQRRSKMMESRIPDF